MKHEKLRRGSLAACGRMFLGVLLLLNLALAQGADRRPPREKWDLVTVQGTVQSIDLETREVLLKGERGNLLTVEASDQVERLHEIQVGDQVVLDYWTYLLAEFRDPTAEEKAEPLVVLAEGGVVPEGFPPGAVVGAIVQGVVTLEVINRPHREVTIKGPRGKFLTLMVKDPNLLEELKAGEVAVLTYAEALALTIEKVKN